MAIILRRTTCPFQFVRCGSLGRERIGKRSVVSFSPHGRKALEHVTRVRRHSVEGERQLDKALERDVQFEELAGAVFACGRLHHYPSVSQSSALESQLAKILERCGASPLQPLLTIMRAAASFPQGARTLPLVKAIALASVNHLHDLDPTASRQILLAFARLHLPSDKDPGRQVYAVVTSALYKQPAALLPFPDQWSLVLNALKRIGYVDRCGSLLHETYTHLEQANLHDWAPRDLALMCNAVTQLESSTKSKMKTPGAKDRFLSRVATIIPDIGPRCSAQDVSHFMAAFATMSKQGNPSSREALQAIALASSLTERHIDSMTPVGLCAMLGAFVRVRALDRHTTPVFRKAMRRVSRSGFQLEPAHLSHLARAFSLWLPPRKLCDDANVSIEDHFMESATLTKREVYSIFESTLRPAISRAAKDFNNPRHIAFVVSALVRSGCVTQLELAPLNALALRLASAQTRPRDPLKWSRFPGRAMSLLAHAFAQPATIANENAIRDILESLVDYLLKDLPYDRIPQNTSGSALARFEASVVCRLPGAFRWSPRGVDMCNAAAMLVLSTQCVTQPNLRDLSMLLNSFWRFEFRDATLVGQLLWHMHKLIWSEAGCNYTSQRQSKSLMGEILHEIDHQLTDKRISKNSTECEASSHINIDYKASNLCSHWDLEVASSTLAALDGLGYLETLANCEGAESQSFLVCAIWASVMLLRHSSELWGFDGHDTMRSHISFSLLPRFFTMARCLLNCSTDGHVDRATRDAVANHLEYMFIAFNWGASLSLQERHWIELVHIVCRLSSSNTSYTSPHIFCNGQDFLSQLWRIRPASDRGGGAVIAAYLALCVGVPSWGVMFAGQGIQTEQGIADGVFQSILNSTLVRDSIGAEAWEQRHAISALCSLASAQATARSCSSCVPLLITQLHNNVINAIAQERLHYEAMRDCGIAALLFLSSDSLCNAACSQYPQDEYPQASIGHDDCKEVAAKLMISIVQSNLGGDVILDAARFNLVPGLSLAALDLSTLRRHAFRLRNQASDALTPMASTSMPCSMETWWRCKDFDMVALPTDAVNHEALASIASTLDDIGALGRRPFAVVLPDT